MTREWREGKDSVGAFWALSTPGWLYFVADDSMSVLDRAHDRYIMALSGSFVTNHRCQRIAQAHLYGVTYA